jgi:hypothetical protein
VSALRTPIYLNLPKAEPPRIIVIVTSTEALTLAAHCDNPRQNKSQTRRVTNKAPVRWTDLNECLHPCKYTSYTCAGGRSGDFSVRWHTEHSVTCEKGCG